MNYFETKKIKIMKRLFYHKPLLTRALFLLAVVSLGGCSPHVNEAPPSQTVTLTEITEITEITVSSLSLWELNLAEMAIDGSSAGLANTTSVLPIIGPEGVIYLATEDRTLYAIDPDNGHIKWAFKTEVLWQDRSRFSAPAIGTDGTIYVMSGDMKLYAIDPVEGAKKWELEIPGEPEFTGYGELPSPAIGAANGTIYLSLTKLYAINPVTQSIKWTWDTHNDDYYNRIRYAMVKPTIGPDGTIYVGSTDTKLYAIDPDGTEKWTFTSTHSITKVPTFGPYGTIYHLDWERLPGVDNWGSDRKLCAINPVDGSIKWQQVIGTGRVANTSPTVGTDGIIYVVVDKLYAINPDDGSTIWASPAKSSLSATVIFRPDSTIYVMSSGADALSKKIIVFNAEDGSIKREINTGSQLSYHIFADDGSYYAGDYQKLYSIDLSLH